MTKTLDAVFDGTVFRPDGTIDIEPNTRVEIVVRIKTLESSKSSSFLDTARSLKLAGPADFSSRLDDYLYGGKKIDEE